MPGRKCGPGAPGPQDDEHDPDRQEDYAGDGDACRDVQESSKPGSQTYSGSYLSTPISVHHDRGPVATLHRPFERLAALALLLGHPEILLIGR